MAILLPSTKSKVHQTTMESENKFKKPHFACRYDVERPIIILWHTTYSVEKLSSDIPIPTHPISEPSLHSRNWTMHRLLRIYLHTYLRILHLLLLPYRQNTHDLQLKQTKTLYITPSQYNYAAFPVERAQNPGQTWRRECNRRHRYIGDNVTLFTDHIYLT